MMPSPSRRVFLRTCSAGLAAAVLSRGTNLLAANETNPADTAALPIVDTHQHLWDLEKFTLPWLENGGPEELRRSFGMQDYLKATQGLNVVKTVYMEVNVAGEQQEKEADFVIELCRNKRQPDVRRRGGRVAAGKRVSAVCPKIRRQPVHQRLSHGAARCRPPARNVPFAAVRRARQNARLDGQMF